MTIYRDTDTDTDAETRTDTTAYHGRRLRCDSCGERFPQSAAYDTVAGHARRCASAVSHPYHPNRVRAGMQADITAYGGAE